MEIIHLKQKTKKKTMAPLVCNFTWRRFSYPFWGNIILLLCHWNQNFWLKVDFDLWVYGSSIGRTCIPQITWRSLQNMATFVSLGNTQKSRLQIDRNLYTGHILIPSHHHYYPLSSKTLAVCLGLYAKYSKLLLSLFLYLGFDYC